MNALNDPVAWSMTILGLVLILAHHLERRGWLRVDDKKDGNQQEGTEAHRSK